MSVFVQALQGDVIKQARIICRQMTRRQLSFMISFSAEKIEFSISSTRVASNVNVDPDFLFIHSDHA